MRDSVDDIINKKIDSIVSKNNIYHYGKVTRINNFIVEVSGLDDAFYFEKVFIGNDENIGYVDKIEEDKIIISIVKTNGRILVGDSVITTGEILQSSYSEDSIGMIIDPFGIDKMSGKKINNSYVIPIETKKISIMERTSVNRPMETGIASIDLMFPIGRGQRQLIIGDKKTGKTQICLDTIANQKDKDVICIYVAIGKNKKELKSLYAQLVRRGAHDYSLIVAAFNDDPAPLIKLTPYVALSIAEVYMRKGKDVLVCIDDLKKHAEVCREIALLTEKNTGRDAYPADIFYTHSRLLEKGCQHRNGGSITILPIVETKGGDITDYISTNVISITDGQIVLSEKMFQKGQKPAVNYGLSVSRLGSAVQKESLKKLGAMVRREVLSYLEIADVYQLVNKDSLSSELRSRLNKGQKIVSLLKQQKFSPLSESDLVERFGFMLEKDDKFDSILSEDGDSSIEEQSDEMLDQLSDNPLEEKESNEEGKNLEEVENSTAKFSEKESIDELEYSPSETSEEDATEDSFAESENLFTESNVEEMPFVDEADSYIESNEEKISENRSDSYTEPIKKEVIEDLFAEPESSFAESNELDSFAKVEDSFIESNGDLENIDELSEGKW